MPDVTTSPSEREYPSAGLIDSAAEEINQWTDQHNPPMTDDEIDSLYIAEMTRRDAERETVETMNARRMRELREHFNRLAKAIA